MKVEEKDLAADVKDQGAGVAVSSLSIFIWIIIVVGAIVLVVGFLGCCGAIRESQCMLATVISSL